MGLVRISLLTLIESMLNSRLSFSKKRHALSVESREEMNFSGTSKKTPPVRRNKIRGIECGGEHRWSAQDTIYWKMRRYLDRSQSFEVDI